MHWAYIAAYLDGEGSVIGSAKHRHRALIWHNTHLESLQAMQAFMKCGRFAAPLLGCSISAVGNALKRYNIDARPRGGAAEKGQSKSALTRARMRSSRQALWADPSFVQHQAELRAARKERA